MQLLVVVCCVNAPVQNVLNREIFCCRMYRPGNRVLCLDVLCCMVTPSPAALMETPRVRVDKRVAVRVGVASTQSKQQHNRNDSNYKSFCL